MSTKNKSLAEGQGGRIGQIIDFWKRNESKIVLSMGIFLIAVISFEVGVLQGHKIETPPLSVQVAPEREAEVKGGLNPAVLGAENPSKNELIDNQTSENPECAFVGSKNSNKYHKPDCRWAKNIKPENLVCFKDEEEAKSRGYIGDKNCVGN
ncbi:MAG: hypothetical protein V3574_01125 [Candidatus Moraniibacteriota bacterium]